jgi:hypothetical protein
MPRIDKAAGRLLPWGIIAGGALLAAVAYFAGPSLTLDVGTIILGVFAGLVAAYFIYRSLEQERTLTFFDGEEVRLTSSDTKTFMVIIAQGDKDLPLQPLRATLHLTNLGIIAEYPGAAEAAAFIPLDRIVDFDPHQGAIRVRFMDVKHQYAEALLYVDDRDLWMRTLADELAKRLR